MPLLNRLNVGEQGGQESLKSAYVIYEWSQRYKCISGWDPSSIRKIIPQVYRRAFNQQMSYKMLKDPQYRLHLLFTTPKNMWVWFSLRNFGFLAVFAILVTFWHFVVIFGPNILTVYNKKNYPSGLSNKWTTKYWKNTNSISSYYSLFWKTCKFVCIIFHEIWCFRHFGYFSFRPIFGGAFKFQPTNDLQNDEKPAVRPPSIIHYSKHVGSSSFC